LDCAHPRAGAIAVYQKEGWNRQHSAPSTAGITRNDTVGHWLWTQEQAQGLLDSLKLNGGMPEWKPEHLQRLRDLSSTRQKDASTIEAQLEFIADELLHSFQAVGTFLKRAHTVEEAKEAVRPYVRRLAPE
jgi:hypothetical protein